ncbi:MAG: hypothetical protein NTW05_18615, partial [Pseudonocardiales bacterium]|nr:hypothetical protein [Pseudonocardiales bacterium]
MSPPSLPGPPVPGPALSDPALSGPAPSPPADVRRPLALWGAAVVLVPALLAAVALVWPGPPATEVAPARPEAAAAAPAVAPEAEVARLLAAGPIVF